MSFSSGIIIIIILYCQVGKQVTRSRWSSQIKSVDCRSPIIIITMSSALSHGRCKADLQTLFHGADLLLRSPVFIGALGRLMDTADPRSVKAVSQWEYAGVRDKGKCRDLGNYLYTVFWLLLSQRPCFSDSPLRNLWVDIATRWPTCCAHDITRRGMERAGDILEFVMGFVNHSSCDFEQCAVSDMRAFNDEFNGSLLALERLLVFLPSEKLAPVNAARLMTTAYNNRK